MRNVEHYLRHTNKKWLLDILNCDSHRETRQL